MTLHVGFDTVEKGALTHGEYAKTLDTRMAEFVREAMDNRTPLATRYTYDVGEPKSGSPELLFVRWAIVIAFTKPQHIVSPGDTYFFPTPKSDLVQVQYEERIITFARLKRRGLENFYNTVSICG